MSLTRQEAEDNWYEYKKNMESQLSSAPFISLLDNPTIKKATKTARDARLISIVVACVLPLIPIVIMYILYKFFVPVVVTAVVQTVTKTSGGSLEGSSALEGSSETDELTPKSTKADDTSDPASKNRYYALGAVSLLLFFVVFIPLISVVRDLEACINSILTLFKTNKIDEIWQQYPDIILNNKFNEKDEYKSAEDLKVYYE
jgi:hypothetical protein